MRRHRATFHWTVELDDLALMNHSIPVLAPRDNSLRMRWEEILNWYGLTQIDENLIPSDSVREPDRDMASREDRVAVIGQHLSPFGAMFEIALGRHMECLESFAELREWLHTRPVRSLILIAPPSVLGATHIRELAAASMNLNFLLGVLTAPNKAALSFATAKLLAAQGAPGSSSAFLDCLYPTAHQADGNGIVRTEDLELILNEDWQTVVLQGHGDGSHLNLNAAVLCGLWEKEERTSTDTAFRGCRYLQSCKKVDSPEIKIVYPGSLKTSLLVLLSCNGFSVAGEMYPSNVS